MGYVEENTIVPIYRFIGMYVGRHILGKRIWNGLRGCSRLWELVVLFVVGSVSGVGNNVFSKVKDKEIIGYLSSSVIYHHFSGSFAHPLVL